MLTARLRRLITASQRYTKSRQILNIHQAQSQSQQTMLLSTPLCPLPPTLSDTLNPKMAAKIERQQRSENRADQGSEKAEAHALFEIVIRMLSEIISLLFMLLSVLMVIKVETFCNSRWTRREEADFYRVVSTFGVVFDPNLGRFDWTKFRAMARLHKKTDESLQKYLCAFTAMCRRVCRLPPKEGGKKLYCLFTTTHTHAVND